MQKITPFLWFDKDAEEAVKFYRSVFKGTKIRRTTRYPKSAANASGQKAGSVMTIVFELMGQEFIALNGGPHHQFTDAISLTVNCKDQKEIDYYWKKLIAEGGKPVACGWLKDKFGLSWQIVPIDIEKWLDSKHPDRVDRVMAQVMQMEKLDLKAIKKAYAGK